MSHLAKIALLAEIIFLYVNVEATITTKQEYFKRLEVSVTSMSIGSPVISTFSHLTYVKYNVNRIIGKFEIALN